ncbi:MAG: hypothetical protein UR53_C0004G0012 [Candidatus Magasanikbacteria bacterium GW2011_GWC2_34_16]|uniref:Uncharacterized protein n=2 Tax=Candidatus Magasanikiibacteriota TaxID=1752731 RepID=A0A0G0JQN2_9BACT|nr:MAG: hypothetical protein UR53_C0004G0012 [Candidatus Magasanikbacteria bacterium GW2011_GWC2_34_16]KKQ39184.1 MAG: hypothetical protein US58_C0039G0003 [Candidatus Magasanikbacteria bacterium GW2011_GWA2_37_8]
MSDLSKITKIPNLLLWTSKMMRIELIAILIIHIVLVYYYINTNRIFCQVKAGDNFLI